MDDGFAAHGIRRYCLCCPDINESTTCVFDLEFFIPQREGEIQLRPFQSSRADLAPVEAIVASSFAECARFQTHLRRTGTRCAESPRAISTNWRSVPGVSTSLATRNTGSENRGRKFSGAVSCGGDPQAWFQVIFPATVIRRVPADSCGQRTRSGRV